LPKKKPVTTKRVRKVWARALTRKHFKRALRFGVILAALLAAIPVLLTFVYASSSINPVSTLMLGRWVTAQPVERRWVKLEQINPVAVYSVMMSEDAKFCSHNGIDWDELNQVIDDAIEGEKTRGASTLSMQVVKNLYLWPGRSFVRKLLELPLALLADGVWSKKRMVEIYLNIAEWDEGVFGIEAAAQRYFNRNAASLSARQSALLAVTLPNPKKRNPAKPSKSLLRLAKNIEQRAYQSGAYVKCVQ